MQAVILAAGMGTRLGREDGMPKCMTEVGHQTIVEHQINALQDIGITKIFVVVGYRKEELIKFINSKFAGIKYVENPDYASTNTIYSLYLATSVLTEDFFYLNGDVIFESGLLEKLKKEEETGLAVEYKPCGEEEVKVKLINQRIVAISKQVPLGDAAGEFIGIGLFRQNMHEAFFNSLKREVEERKNVRDYFEHALDVIAQDVEMISVDITGEPVIEIDFPEDLEKAREMVKKAPI